MTGAKMTLALVFDQLRGLLEKIEHLLGDQHQTAEKN